MKTTLAVLLATSAVIGALGVPALATMRAPGDLPGLCDSGVCTALSEADDQPMPLLRVSGDDDDDGGRVRRRHDDDDDDDDDDCDDDDDDDCMSAGGRGNPAPAGTVPPPANGLFGNGAPPVAVTN